MRRQVWKLALPIAVGFPLLVQPAGAVIEAVSPMKEILRHTEFIFTANVETFDKEKGLVVLTVQENHKGKVPFKQLELPLPPDKEGMRENNRPSFLAKRLAVNLPVVIFADNGRSKAFDKVRPEGMTLFLYTNGTWAQIAGHAKLEGQTKMTLRFHHYEPYLRRTFKGSTAEMRQVIIDGLSGQKEPPAPDVKEPGGLGPEVKP